MESTGTYIAQDGTEIWYATSGQGPAMIFCDGFACDGFIWPYLVDHFVSDYQIVRWHYRGHGYSTPPEDFEQLTIHNLVEDLEGILDVLQIQEAILLGHSMGVQVILQCYEAFPERIRALVPICGTYERPLDTFKNTDLLSRMLPYLEQLVESAPHASQSFWNTAVPSTFSYALSYMTELNPRLVRAADFRPYLDHAARLDLKLFVTMLHHLADHSARHILETIEVPTLIVAAEHDSFTPMDRSEFMAETIPSSELIVLPDAGHAGPIELPDTVIGAIEKFLTQHGLAASPRQE